MTTAEHQCFSFAQPARDRFSPPSVGRAAPFALALVLIGLASPPAQAAPQPHEQTLHLVWIDVSGTAALPLAAAIEEARRLLEPAGLPISAHQEAAGHAVPGGSMVVIFGHDRTSLDTATFWGVARADTDSAVWAYPERVASALGLDPAMPHVWPAGADIRFRRLLGVVVAHELLHRLAGAPHADQGLMAAALSTSDPVFDFRIDKAFYALLQDGVARLSVGQPLQAMILQ